MMELTDKGLADKKVWEEKGYSLPHYDRAIVRNRTTTAPIWLHFGGGNIFRAFQANVVQKLLNDGIMNKGLIVVASSDPNVIRHVYQEHDNLCLLVTFQSDGTRKKTVIGSLMESFAMDFTNPNEKHRLTEIITSPSLQLASFTITEKGYQIKDAAGQLLPAVQADIKNGPQNPHTYLGRVTALVLARYQAQTAPLALVSMDNISCNGDKLREAIHCYAQGWIANGYAEQEFLNYINDPHQVSFPLTMIDKITPRPSTATQKLLARDDIQDLCPFVTARGSHVAPYVNAEETQYLVIEDNFPNGRPPLEQGGIFFTDRETVRKCEKMKVCCCLNPLHTALAVFGCLLGYTKIADEMNDSDLLRLLKCLGYQEGLPVIQDPSTDYAALNPKEFLRTCITVRFPNPFLPDTPQRIATDTSQKLAIRYGETVKAYIDSPQHDPAELQFIPLIYAGWLRYLLGQDDAGQPFQPSPDPLLTKLQQTLAALPARRPLSKKEAEHVLAPILHDATIFGIDLYTANLTETVLQAFCALTAGPGAVRHTLHTWPAI